MKIRFLEIKWDTDGESVVPELPDEVVLTVGDDVDVDLEGADVLSDEYGWCVFGFNWELVE